MEHFITNELLSNKQYGFIKGRSTVLQLLRILHDWTTQIDQDYQVDVIYTDFEKAFDKVPHQRLLNKLKSYGITDALLKWIENFLCSRKQCIGVNGKFSKWFLVKSEICLLYTSPSPRD